MRPTTIAAALLLALPLVAHAQVRKCVDTAGKTVYSDVVCADTRAKETAIRTDQNSIDTSGLRAQGQRMQNAEAVNNLVANPPIECRFRSFSYGDPKGKALADNARRECVQNILAAQQGQPQSLTAYQMWKDHSGQEQSRRDAALARAATADAARQAREATEDAARANRNRPVRELTCTRNSLNSDLHCK